MRKLVFLVCLFFPGLVFGAGSAVPLDHADYDLTDNESLQRGARTFVNYCLGCHQMQYQRYQRTFTDLGIPDEVGAEYLQFTGEKVFDHMTNTMPNKNAETWFGAAPPDLTLVARVRGPDWLYTYLRSFYEDESRPFGVNNLVFPEVGMPHVLQELQGLPRKTTEMHLVDGDQKERYVGIKADGSGTLNGSEFDQLVLDLVNFLVYTGEPVILEREALGKKVLIYVLILFVFVFLLKKEYWRDVH